MHIYINQWFYLITNTFEKLRTHNLSNASQSSINWNRVNMTQTLIIVKINIYRMRIALFNNV